jgi:DHA1 family bicyclomycin/chloramphenicol resistance-like MFS transporter
MGLTLAQTVAFAFFASYLATSELFVGDVFGLADWFPLIFGASSLLIGAGMLLNPRLLDRFGLRRWLRYVLTGYLVAALVFAGIALATGGRPPFWLYIASLAPILLAHAFVIPNLNSAAMMPMGNIAGTAAAVIGSIATLGGAVISVFINSAFDGTIAPFALAGAVISLVVYVAYRWADRVWDDAAERDLIRPDQSGQATTMLSGDVS